MDERRLGDGSDPDSGPDPGPDPDSGPEQDPDPDPDQELDLVPDPDPAGLQADPARTCSFSSAVMKKPFLYFSDDFMVCFPHQSDFDLVPVLL